MIRLFKHFVLHAVWLLGLLVVKLDSKGAACFRQQRAGLYEEPFTLIKLLWMRAKKPFLDIVIRLQTLRVILWPEGAR